MKNCEAMSRIFITAVVAMFIGTLHVNAQDGLPDFTIENLGKNRVSIGWQNQYGDGLKQVNVQVSYDSLRNFGSVFEPLSPQLPQNGFLNNKEYGGKVYYRLFYVLNGGAYYFTPSKAVPDQEDAEGGSVSKRAPIARERMIIVRTYMNVVARIRPSDFAKFRDSIGINTKDTLQPVGQDEMLIKYYQPDNPNLPSEYVGTNAEGYVEIKLPNAKVKNYKIIFNDSNGNYLFTIKKINDTDVVIDKTNFLRAGWYSFQLFEGDKLLENKKVLLQNDF